MTLDEFLAGYEYARGRFGAWRILNHEESGDCNDFALTVRSIMREGDYYLVRSPVNRLFPRHVALKTSRGWIDSTVREFRDTPEPHKIVCKLPMPWVWFRRMPPLLQIGALAAPVVYGMHVVIQSGLWF